MHTRVWKSAWKPAWAGVMQNIKEQSDVGFREQAEVKRCA